MKIQVTQYTQNNQDFLSAVFPVETILSTSEILIYGDVEGGYQRKPNPLHIKRITKYILDNKHTFIFPSSIILGADESIKNNIVTDSSGCWLKIDENNKIFRVVDGQHRTEGLREAINKDKSLAKFPLQVIIALSKESNRSVELQIFTDINSKAKRINTDLAELARFDYEILENHIDKNNINRHIGIKTAYYLKDKKESVWHNAIKFDIHAEVTIGIIGIKMFSESISKLIEKYRKDNPVDLNTVSSSHLILYCNEASEYLGAFLSKIWDNVIKQKWEATFKRDFVTNDEGDIVPIYYSKEYYIQKGIGIHAINPIIGDICNEYGFNDAERNISKAINESKITTDDWRMKGPFAGFNSGSGFGKVRRAILNEETV
ncbi:DGQHR domain-containing protein [Sphingobacterium nematocida]|uniref:DGQHR domain-containing protein n=1 Tax=Sphingobacterium nematocida TaxID=1513896 RepID=A0A1T5B0S5_9SPHI|nr:DGQHR domain-containing protein [Sphingobacterium nematocida]SKB40657.1 DGQHR domain-containing protein [Sphingobacterium nematocida]